MRRGAWGVALVACLCLALAVVITNSSETPILSSPQLGEVSEPPGPDSGEGGPVLPQSDVEPNSRDFPGWLWVVFYILLILFLFAMLLIMWGSVRRKRAMRLAAFTPSDLDELSVEAERRLAEAVQAQLDDLRSGSPRNAVVACWLSLEDAVEGLGFHREPSLTSAEFTEAVLAAYTVDGRTIQRLSSLYREARFSAHPMTETHRETAAAALRTLRTELGARAAARPRTQEPQP